VSIISDSLSLIALQIPGNDDSGAMAALLVFHILGLYPVPSSTQFLIGSPLVSNYSIHNNFFGTNTQVTVEGFDPASLVASPAEGARYFVQSIAINGVLQDSRCWVDFRDVFAKSASVVITVTANTMEASDCGKGDHAIPDSLSTGGFS
jgi:putative alpha-1,2-mannosidase